MAKTSSGKRSEWRSRAAREATPPVDDNARVKIPTRMVQIIRPVAAPAPPAGERERIAELVAAATALADKVDATSECDHTRIGCEEIGCIGAEVRKVRNALSALRSDGRDA